ncbi:MAG: DUF975 family protein [Oscillospiraceae bacterium]|nr:DUF975 family protein [Oscillospiraceae bacterium]
MQANSNIVKKTARAALKDNFVKAIFFCLTVVFSMLAVYIIETLLCIVFPDVIASVIVALLLVFLIAPLMLGMLRAFWRIMWNSDDTVEVVFYYFSSREEYERSLRLIFGIVFRTLWIGFLLFLPALFTDALSSVRVYEFFGMSAPSFASNLWVLSAFLKIAALIVLYIITLKYYLAPFLFVADGEMDAAEAIHKSTLLSRATAIDFLLLTFSFFGWFLISFTVIPVIFTIPYFIMSYIVHSRFAVANYNKVAKQFSSGEDDFQFSAESIEL